MSDTCETAQEILKNGKERGVLHRQPEIEQMVVLVANSTPYVIWSASGSLVGACKTLDQARGLMRDLKATFPHKDYICRDVDGDLCADTRTGDTSSVTSPHAKGEA